MTHVHSDVVIIGAGPTGLSLALLLARSGVRCALIEKNAAPQPHPAACILNTRTMEVFREIGADDWILERCQNVFNRANITWVTTLSGRELGRCSALPNDLASVLALSPVHATHFPQNRLEPLLWKRTWECPLIEFLPGHECVAIHDADNGVTCSIIGRDGTSRPISADYLVACDGASSFVRRFIGARAEGRILQHMIGVYFTTDLSELIEHRKSILYWTLNPNAFGVLIAHWLPDEWVLFVPYFPPQQSAAEFSKERCRALVNAAIGASTFDINIRLVRPWTVAANLASHYRRGHIFLAGDAAHSFPPTGGFGLNTGVQDAHNLAWKLAAVLKGAAGSNLLETYEQERRPVAKANLEHSQRNFENMSDILRVVGLDLRHLQRLQGIQNAMPFRQLPQRWQRTMLNVGLRIALGRLLLFAGDDERGAKARQEFSQRISGQMSHYRFLGLDLGFTYERGAFIAELTPKPQAIDPIADYRPTTWPSARLPHLWVEKSGVRISIHDALARNGFTLLTHTTGSQTWRLALAAIDEKFRAFVRCLAIGRERGTDLSDASKAWVDLSEVEPNGAVLVRPDGHVAWRARSLPAAPAERLNAVLSQLLCL